MEIKKYEIKECILDKETLESSELRKAIRDRHFYERQRDYFEIERVIFNPPATIVIWKGGTKTVVKCNGEKFDQEKGLAMAISKRALAVGNRYHKVFKKWCKEEDDFSELFEEELKEDEKQKPKLKDIRDYDCFSLEVIHEDEELNPGETVVVVATREELSRILIPERYMFKIGEMVMFDDITNKIHFDDGSFWWIPSRLLRRVVANAKTK